MADVPDATEENSDPEAPEVPAGRLPDHTLIYTLPSRYCLPDVLAGEAWTRFGGLEPGYKRVQAICDHVNGHLTFRYGSSTASSTAVDVNESRYGVCRDFTHLAISFCRALNIPARYIFGYLPDMDVPRTRRRWTSRPGWKYGSAIAGGPLTRATTPAARAGSYRPRPDATDVAVATTFGGPVLESMTVEAEELR